MKEQALQTPPRLPFLAAATGLLLAAGASRADITYVDAQEGATGNTYATGGTPADTSWIDLVSNSAGTDDENWMKRSGGNPGWSQHNGGDVIQGNVTGFPNNLGEITTEITGLADGTYDVWVFFWEQNVSGTQNWLIEAGLASGSLTAYSSPIGPVAGTDSTTAVDAGTLTFTNAPSVTGAGGNQTMFGVNLGQVSVAGGAPIKVYVDKLTGVGSNNRTVFDGVGYEFVGPLTPPELVSTDPADDATGVVTTTNLVAVFNEVVQPGTGSITLKRMSDDATIEVLDINDTTPPGTVTFDGTTVTIDPTDDLAGASGYHVLIDAGAIENTVGQFFPGLADPGEWNFTTDGTAPSSTAMSPMAGTIGTQPGAGLSLTFDEEVLGVAGKFISLHLADGTVVEAIDASNAVVSGGVVSIPTALLSLGTSYYVTVEAGAFTDLSGNPFGGVSDPSAWTFTTALTAITYVDAQEGPSGNTYATGGSLADTSWIDLVSNTASNDDENWMKRSGGSPGWSQHNGGDVIQGSVTAFPNNLGEITTELTGLADGTYNIWVFFWEQTVSSSQDWMIEAGLVSGSLNAYSTPLGPVPGTDTASPVDANLLAFTNSPSITGAGGNQTMFGVNLGQVAVTGGAPVSVFVDKLSGTGSGNRTIFDGVGHQLVAGGPPLQITSFASAGPDLWELTLAGAPDTAYEFRSSPTLDFAPGTLVTGLSQGDPGDPGSVGGGGDSRVTTDGNGDATVRLALAGPANFLRAQLPPPLLEEDFEADDGGFQALTTEGTPWEWGTPDSGGLGGSVTGGAGGSATCWGTGLGNPGYYANPTTTCLRSPVLDLTGLTAARLTFAMAIDLEAGDSVTINIIDDTTDSVIAADIVAITDGDTLSAAWATVGPLELPPAALGQPVRIEWCLSGTGGSSADYMGWYIDDVVVTDSTP